jgi:hypothetical protein
MMSINHEMFYKIIIVCLKFFQVLQWHTHMPENYTFGCLMVRIQFGYKVASSVTFSCDSCDRLRP